MTAASLPPSSSGSGSGERATSRRPPAVAIFGAVAGVVGVVGPALIVAGLFLSLYTSHHRVVPVGADTTQYVWRMKVVESGGLDALPTSLPAPNQPQADRPGYPILGALGRAVTGVTPFRLAYVAPAVLGVAIGLAGAALARGGMTEPTWAFPVYAVLIGASVNVAITGNGYMDNLVVDGVLLAAALAALLAADGRPAIAGAIFLMAGAVSIEWIFVVFFALLLGGLAVLLGPESIDAARTGTKLWRTPAARVAAIAAGTVPFGLGAAFLAPALHGPPHGLRHHGQLRKLRDQLPFYKFKWIGPAAVAGAAATALPPRRPRVRSLLLLGMWALTPLPLVYLLHHGHTVPAQRILGFAFGIPLLATAALVGVARFASAKLWWPGRFLAAVFLLAAMSGGAFLAWQAWSTRQASVPPKNLDALALAGRYVGTTPQGRKVVFVVQRPGLEFPGIASFRRIRAFVPGDRVDDVFVYVGTIDDAVAAKPTSAAEWKTLGPIMRSHPVVAVLQLYYADFATLQTRHPGWVAGPGLLVARGPRPAAPLAAPHIRVPPGNASLYTTTAGLLLLLFVAGIGWSVGLLPTGALARAGAAPAFGIAALVLSGLVADRLGFSLTGGSGIAIDACCAAAGGAVAALRGGRMRRLLPGARRAVALPDRSEASG